MSADEPSSNSLPAYVVHVAFKHRHREFAAFSAALHHDVQAGIFSPTRAQNPYLTTSVSPNRYDVGVDIRSLIKKLEPVASRIFDLFSGSNFRN